MNSLEITAHTSFSNPGYIGGDAQVCGVVWCVLCVCV